MQHTYSEHIVENVAGGGLGAAKYRRLTDKCPVSVPSLAEESYLLAAMDWQKGNCVGWVGGQVSGITYVLTMEQW